MTRPLLASLTRGASPAGAARRWVWPAALAALGGVALVLRILHLQALRGTPFTAILVGDSEQFDILARRILAGEWMESGAFYQGQLYPYFLGLAYATVGDDTVAVRLLQCVLGAAACVLLAMAGARFFDRPSGLAAGALIAVYPPAIFFDGLIQKSSPDLFLMSALLLALGATLRSRHTAWVLLAGVAIGALSWNRENARVLFPLAAVWLWFAFRDLTAARRVRWLAALTIGACLVLGPVALRNLKVTGEMLLTTSQLGPNFYIGNRAGATGGYEPLEPGRGNFLYERQDAIRIAEAERRRPLTASEVSDFWVERTLRDIRSDPAAWVRLMFKKAWMTVAAHEPLDTESLEAYARHSRVLRILAPMTFGVLLALAAFGAWTTRHRWRELAILYAIFVTLALSVAAFFVFARYRFPLVPVAALFAGAGACALAELRTSRPRRSLVALGVCVLLAAVLHIPIRVSSDETFFNYGNELLRRGRAGEAVPLLRDALRDDPEHIEARLSLGLALLQQSQPRAAADEFRAAAAAMPEAFQAHVGLATALHQLGDAAGAIRAYEAALAIDAKNIETISNLALALQQQGRLREAETRLREAVAIEPRNIAVLMNLGGTILEGGRPAEAALVFHRAAAAADTPANRLQAHYAAGQAFAQAGQIADAIRSLDAARQAAVAASDARALATIDAGLALLRGAGR